METVKIDVDIPQKPYQVLVGAGFRGERGALIAALRPSGILLVTDENVTPLYMEGVLGEFKEALPEVTTKTCILPPGEAAKSADSLAKVYDSALSAPALDRDGLIVALGGGAVGDVAGYTAATLLRGIRWVQFPTTLLAMLDSAIGGKTAINHPAGKNLVGAFHQPSAVVCDVAWLDTLPMREYTAGLAEGVKTAVVADEALFGFIESHTAALLERDKEAVARLVEGCVRIKARLVAEDERDTTGRRALLNFGHTLGHALESLFPGRYLHGEAVAIGMVGAVLFSQGVCGLRDEDADRLTAVLEALGLKLTPPELDADGLLRAIATDKKRAGGAIRIVCLARIGEGLVVNCGLDERLVVELLGQEDE